MAVYPGSSGGAVVDADSGALIGLVTSYSQVSFALLEPFPSLLCPWWMVAEHFEYLERFRGSCMSVLVAQVSSLSFRTSISASLRSMTCLTACRSPCWRPYLLPPMLPTSPAWPRRRPGNILTQLSLLVTMRRAYGVSNRHL